YTSGTTGKPKGIIRENGGHAVAMKFSMDYVYDVQPGEVYWAASDFGWVVGHSYIAYAPLINGNSTIIYEGKPVRTPDAGAFWRVIEEYKVSVFFTAPTAFRAIRREDPEATLLQQYDLSSLRAQFVAGERCDASTLEWLQDILKVPVIDHWWQTESGYPMLSKLLKLGTYPVKPGSAGKPVPGFDVAILDHNGKPQGPNEEGMLMIRYPLAPGALCNLWQDTERFKRSYLGLVNGYYFSGDGAYMDEDGYVFVTGRVDDVINVAGHRLSTADMEEIIAAHPAVSECAVVGRYDALKGQVPVGLTVLKEGAHISEEQLQKELIQMVRDKIGAVASFKQSFIVNTLPKTRSGKIL
ncbi:MAG: AMP-binding protein, partial [Phaeodactylibacter sp.]|nr:AMP-binding protein [Phaeodactylibacter sp.]